MDEIVSKHFKKPNGIWQLGNRWQASEYFKEGSATHNPTAMHDITAVFPDVWKELHTAKELRRFIYNCRDLEQVKLAQNKLFLLGE